ncbi:hypothetical protein L202_00997 [Cryptococcus amylolentus CBS 6039]|uniref:Uncharacterized protein n=1 Tax=Cryptococcus amylolentus CBS 6039 TaxID=1295533 RepID=A0A1E3I2I1_9TREE|nr:hypothetical protein L202_00997 [Cryptococcus amylolentus CBS 6039]ODN82707.1 hypothetical protein L202_00997 [Cryptococcus amylolentus CBS 6039]
MLFGNALSLLSLAGYVSVNSVRDQCSNKVDFLSELLGKVFCCSDDNRTDPENGLTCPLRMVHAQGGDVVIDSSSQRLDINSAPRHRLGARLGQYHQPQPQQPQAQSQSQEHTYPPHPVSSPHPSSAPSRSPSSPSPSESIQQLQQQLQQLQQSQQPPPQPQPPESQQPWAHALWQRVSLPIQQGITWPLSLSAVCLIVGLGLDWNSPTVAGGALRNYAAPGLWLIGAFVWYPSVIAVWRRVPGAQLRARRWV